MCDTKLGAEEITADIPNVGRFLNLMNQVSFILVLKLLHLSW